MKTPVALIIFKRPDTTARVFETIRQVKPSKLLIIADGPRADRSGEVEQCIATRAIVEKIDWDCEVLRNYSDTNLGCGLRPATGISWVFEQVEEAIILEDDCLPHPSFFQFCEELLEKYRNDTQIMHISGNNFQYSSKRNDFSYYFSHYPHIWGWATWRRAWKYFDINIENWHTLSNTDWLKELHRSERTAEFWKHNFNSVHNPTDLHIWDYQWTFACWLNKKLCITPSGNLVSNIGFGDSATHTKGLSPVFDLSTKAMSFPLKHPPSIHRHISADNFTTKLIFTPSVSTRMSNKLKKTAQEVRNLFFRI